MSNVIYSNASPYAATPQSSWYLGKYIDRPIPAAGDDQTITIDHKYQYRPDLLSYDLYQSPAYWWIFMTCNLNVIRDPIWDFTAGTQIIVPSLSTLRSALGV